MAIDFGSVLWVTDYWNGRVDGFDSQGKYVAQFGNGLLSDPEGIAIDPSGDLWVADKGNNRGLEFSPVPNPPPSRSCLPLPPACWASLCGGDEYGSSFGGSGGWPASGCGRAPHRIATKPPRRHAPP